MYKRPVLTRRRLFAAGGGLVIQQPLAWRALAASAPIYVSPDGEDANDGRSEATPIRTLDMARRRLMTGSTILLRAGGVWRESLPVLASHVRIEPYGGGPRPIISGADRLTDDLVGPRGDVWEVRLPHLPLQLFVDGERGEQVADRLRVRWHRQWAWAKGKLYVRGSSSQTRPDVEASLRSTCLDASSGYFGLSVEGLDLRYAASHCVFLGAAAQPTIRNCHIVGAYDTGITFGTDFAHDNGLLEGNLVEGHGGTGISGGGRISGWVVRNNEVVGCGRLHNEMKGGSGAHTWTAGIKIWGWVTPGLQGSLEISGNHVRDCGPHTWAPANSLPHNLGVGIWLDEIFAPRAPQMVTGNRVENCLSRGIFFEKSDTCVARGNTIDGCGNARYTAGFSIQGNGGRGAVGNTAEKNTIRGGWWAAEFGGDDLQGFNDNRFRDNIVVGGLHQQLYIVGGGANEAGRGSGNMYNNNCVGSPNIGFLTWLRPFSTVSLFEKASKGSAYKNIDRDPLLVDQDSDDLRLAADSPCIGTASTGGNIGAG